MQDEDLQAVVQILAEPPGGHFRLQIAMGGGDDPKIHLAPLQRAHRAEFALLDKAQQLDLHFERQVADLIEKGRAAVGQLDETLLVSHGSAEGAFHVSEELAFHQRAHQRPAVYGDELAARVGLVYGARHHLLARSAFSQQQNRQTVARRLPDQPPDGADLGRLAHQAVG